ncbi:TPA: nucleotide sugar dehydrogenase [Patescibacteria group bacterium]|nr:nucleotide sugar dehydrogenase [Patescibacteria group bacterium]|tara:strand:- start:5967 stop:7286 length:1320 start_codon:yes stop_codon:yes gene_type:complete
MVDKLEQAIVGREAKVGIIGLGYVGLPLAKAFINAKLSVIGFDVDPQKVDFLLSGKSYLKQFKDEDIKQWLDSGLFNATTDMSRLTEADCLLICVPTPLTSDHKPDLKYIIQTAESIKQSLRPGQLVVLESTTYPSTTRQVLLPILEESGLKAGQDFFLAYSPEREDPGNTTYSASSIPKVVGGLDEDSGRLAQKLYEQAVVSVVPVSSPEIAEACKILENTYRAVNIALINELKILFDKMEIDVWEVVEAAKTKPFGFQAFYPGPGLGGHCIPIDPFYLSWLAKEKGLETKFIELAGQVNSKMPRYVVDRLEAFLQEQGKQLVESKVCMLGVAYKKDVDDPRESPAFEILDLLRQRGAVVSYNDPYIPKLPKMRNHEVPELKSTELTADFLADQDVVLIVTNHSDYDYQFIVEHSQLVVDTRNATKNVVGGEERIRKA